MGVVAIGVGCSEWVDTGGVREMDIFCHAVVSTEVVRALTIHASALPVLLPN